MPRSARIPAAGLAAGLAALAGSPALAQDGQGRAPAQLGYPDFGYMPQDAPNVDRVFRLSQDFPESRPKPPKQGSKLYKILHTDFKGANWKTYLNRVKEYVFKGNLDQPGYANDFDPHRNAARDWYHMPWLHWGPQGREGIHGLTREGPLAKQALAPSQKQSSHAYAVGIFNSYGGYPIGQVWRDPGKPPDLSYFRQHNGFPNGTVIAKLLFTPLGERQVPWLKNPLTWQAYVVADDIPGCRFEACSSNRALADVHLLQMDIMVRDDRVKKNGGWIFGTFAYNGNLANENKWENLVPVGLMWGNDPDNRHADYTMHPSPQKGTPINPKLDQTVINKSDKLPAMHLGFNGRLSGPADNPKSSCMSCHSTAQYPNASPIMPFLAEGVPTPKPGTQASEAWMRWFRNPDWGEAFDEGEGVVNLDFSLQLSKSIKRYVEYLDTAERGQYAAQFWHSDHAIRRNKIAE